MRINMVIVVTLTASLLSGGALAISMFSDDGSTSTEPEEPEVAPPEDAVDEPPVEPPEQAKVDEKTESSEDDERVEREPVDDGIREANVEVVKPDRNPVPDKPSRDAVRRAIRDQQSKVSRCAMRSRGAGSAGRVEVEIDIEPSGRVSSVDVDSAGISRRMERCVSSTVRGFHFPESKLGLSDAFRLVLQ